VIRHILLAVEDSPGSLRAARLGVELARASGASVRAVTVLPDHELAGRIGDGARRHGAAVGVLAYVASLAAGATVAIETMELDGEPAQRILEQARAWPADLIVVGRCREPGVGRPYVGSQARAILEFAEAPVLVVPHQP
jgi:nucleotide-binding universal stress UspA family protein